jgi:hypothetical protein
LFSTGRHKGITYGYLQSKWCRILKDDLFQGFGTNCKLYISSLNSYATLG